MIDTPKTSPADVREIDDSGAAAVAPTKHGQGLLHRVETRKAELRARLEQLATGGRGHDGHGDIEEALAAVEDLLTGDLTNVAEPTATQLNQWLATSRYLCDDEKTATAARAHVKAEARADAKAAKLAAANERAANEAEGTETTPTDDT